MLQVAGQFVDLAAAERHLRLALSSSSCSSAAVEADVEADARPQYNGKIRKIMNTNQSFSQYRFWGAVLKVLGVSVYARKL